MSKPRVCKNAETDSPHSKRDAPYPGPRCLTCHRAASKTRAKAAHGKRVQSVYGLREGEYDLLYEAQGGRCAILNCRARGLARRLAVDHDHKLEHLGREAVRGLLCSKHNQEIGDNGDDPEVFLAIARYLLDPPAQKILAEIRGEIQ